MLSDAGNLTSRLTRHTYHTSRSTFFILHPFTSYASLLSHFIFSPLLPLLLHSSPLLFPHLLHFVFRFVICYHCYNCGNGHSCLNHCSLPSYPSSLSPSFIPSFPLSFLLFLFQSLLSSSFPLSLLYYSVLLHCILLFQLHSISTD
jgi:hypothetical protein